MKTYFYYKTRKPHTIVVLDSCAEIIIPNATVTYDIFEYSYYYDEAPPEGRIENSFDAYVDCETGFKRYGPRVVHCDQGAWNEPIRIIRCVPNDQGRFNLQT